MNVFLLPQISGSFRPVFIHNRPQNCRGPEKPRYFRALRQEGVVFWSVGKNAGFGGDGGRTYEMPFRFIGRMTAYGDSIPADDALCNQK